MINATADGSGLFVRTCAIRAPTSFTRAAAVVPVGAIGVTPLVIDPGELADAAFAGLINSTSIAVATPAARSFRATRAISGLDARANSSVTGMMPAHLATPRVTVAKASLPTGIGVPWATKAAVAGAVSAATL